MSRQPKMDRPSVTAWRAESLRITAFPVADAVVTPETWWKDVVGAEATVETLRKGRLIRQDQGDALGGVLALTVQPGRIDWHLGAKIPQDEPPQDFPSLGRAAETLPRFVDVLTQWLPSCPPIARFALGVNALIPVSGHDDAYALLDALLPAVEVDHASADFLYRISRPRPSRLQLPGLRINRLSTWTAMRLDLFALTGGAQPFRSETLFAVRTELDINTTADFAGRLPQESLSDLCREFVDLAIEILTEGDRP